MGGSMSWKILLLLLVSIAFTRSLLVEASCGLDVGSAGYHMSCRSLLQAPIGAADEPMSTNGNLSLAIPAAVVAPAGGGRFLGALRAVGHQHYSFNGTAWVVYNATAWMYEAAGQPNTSEAQVPVVLGREAVVGVHFFLAEPDASGGQPSWLLGSSRVTAKSLAATTVDSASITWNLLQATTYQLIVSDAAPSSDSTISWVGEVTFVQRLDTQGGLPPSLPTSSAALPSVGDSFSSVYAALYAFYAT
ncbi:hypothetical protein L7F22_016611 [Adiantum nelumboides]|nr:hypothetical protein [Adiantum nelumboides]